ncbi:MAG: GNAT family N-acetyltransferase [Porticoccaceae bacterium]|jgi:ribosomal protein S18 acetylase RimI-like enzyme|nr:GNAT family N-acetyltransferase [Porticoccaceae bacterium]
MNVREAQPVDFAAIWPIFQQIVAMGDTYGYERDITEQEARRVWMELPAKTFVAEQDGQILGTYYIKTNQTGPGSHVCNCGYMVATDSRGRGLASIMCEHSQKVAIELGFEAMQFNFVATTNDGAVNLWKKLGFNIVGVLPKAFNHPLHGNVDALVMHKFLD